VKIVDYHPEEKKITEERKHFESQYGYERPYTNQVRTYRPDGNFNSDSRYALEDMMTRKRKITSLDVQRNSLATDVPGDKFYRNPECTDGFYKMEGVMPGSTFYYQKEKKKLGKTLSRKVCPFYDTHDFSVKTLDPSRLWKNKSEKQTIDQDALYVKTVTEWDKAFMKTVKPEIKISAKPLPKQTRQSVKQVTKKSAVIKK
jgi:hypothetical protein